MKTLKLTDEEIALLTDGLDHARDEILSENRVKVWLGQPIEALEKIDALVTKLRDAV